MRESSTRYFGKVCAKHPDLEGERRRANRTCAGCERDRPRRAVEPEKRRARDRARYAADPEPVKARARAWRAANPEKANSEKDRARGRLRYAADPGRAAARNRTWRAAHPEKRKSAARARYAVDPRKYQEANRTWNAANPDKRRALDAKRRARKANAAVPLTAADAARIQALHAEARRRTEETGVEHHVDHDKPLARGGLHHPDNLLVVPAAINYAKGARYASTLEFLLS